MKRVTIIVTTALLGIGGLALGFGLTGNDGEGVPMQGTQAADDPCAEYVAQGIACEYIAFPDMEIRPELGNEVAHR